MRTFSFLPPRPRDSLGAQHLFVRIQLQQPLFKLRIRNLVRLEHFELLIPHAVMVRLDHDLLRLFLSLLQDKTTHLVDLPPISHDRSPSVRATSRFKKENKFGRRCRRRRRRRRLVFY